MHQGWSETGCKRAMSDLLQILYLIISVFQVSDMGRKQSSIVQNMQVVYAQGEIGHRQTRVLLHRSQIPHMQWRFTTAMFHVITIRVRGRITRSGFEVLAA